MCVRVCACMCGTYSYQETKFLSQDNIILAMHISMLIVPHVTSVTSI